MFDVMGYALLVVGFVISQENLKDRATEFLEYLKRDRPSARAAFKEVLTSIPYLFRMELRTFPKVVGMCVCYTVLYGIVNNLHTTRINFDFFSTNQTHLGPYMERFWPKVYKSQYKPLFAIILGTVGTWWVGLIFGFIVAAVQRKNGMPRVDLHIPLSTGCLATCIAVSTFGEAVQLAFDDGFLTVNLMHILAYFGGPPIVLYVLGAYISFHGQRRLM